MAITLNSTYIRAMVRIFWVNIFLFANNCLFGQIKGNPLNLEVICSSSQDLRLSNQGSDTVIYPGYTAVDQIRNPQANLAYEIEYFGKDTVTVGANYFKDISLRHDRTRILKPLAPSEFTLFEALLPKNIFEKKGSYRVRFVFRNGESPANIEPVVSEWKYFSWGYFK